MVEWLDLGSMIVRRKLREERTELVERRFLWNQARSRQIRSPKNLMVMHVSSASVTGTGDYPGVASCSLDSFTITTYETDLFSTLAVAQAASHSSCYRKEPATPSGS